MTINNDTLDAEWPKSFNIKDNTLTANQSRKILKPFIATGGLKGVIIENAFYVYLEVGEPDGYNSRKYFTIPDIDGKIMLFKFRRTEYKTSNARGIGYNGAPSEYWVHYIKKENSDTAIRAAISNIPQKALLNSPERIEAEYVRDKNLEDVVAEYFKDNPIVYRKIKDGVYNNNSLTIAIMEYNNSLSDNNTVEILGRDIEKIGYLYGAIRNDTIEIIYDDTLLVYTPDQIKGFIYNNQEYSAIGSAGHKKSFAQKIACGHMSLYVMQDCKMQNLELGGVAYQCDNIYYVLNKNDKNVTPVFRAIDGVPAKRQPGTDEDFCELFKDNTLVYKRVKEGSYTRKDITTIVNDYNIGIAYFLKD